MSDFASGQLGIVYEKCRDAASALGRIETAPAIQEEWSEAERAELHRALERLSLVVMYAELYLTRRRMAEKSVEIAKLQETAERYETALKESGIEL